MCRGRCDTVLAKHRANSCKFIQIQLTALQALLSCKEMQGPALVVDVIPERMQFHHKTSDYQTALLARTSHRWSSGESHGVLPCPTRQKTYNAYQFH